ncbi:type II toxin-antitoxin system HipA family toxin [uncultured Cohaesibacter sp.]|uniref:type II toxin-antitoxin system HipA family toxin n=1 Tax=uncultured Cohaesibacter sp. TaxID=1002546 RepID=UPI00292DACE3|nr:type II toxin-antitoxin system HipA family toxin [uncultured Cohaesibacter sp.]
MSFSPISEIRVGLDFTGAQIPVGRLATRDRKIYFEYNDEFLGLGLHISPFSLPLEPGLKTFEPTLFQGLPGVFNDSLPDGWGRLLIDRTIRQSGILPQQLTPLDRLAHVGHRGMGALVYEPNYRAEDVPTLVDLDLLASQAEEVLTGEAPEVLAELLAVNGSSAGARPKAVIGVSQDHQTICHSQTPLQDGYSHWLVKFATSMDGIDGGVIEYVYALMAQAAGLNMPEIHLFPAQQGPGYFAVKRFDRVSEQRLHVHSACGLLHSDFRTPALDYEQLLALTEKLTRDVREVEKMFRLAVFNVLAHNRDDHSKNFSFLMDRQGEWTLSPAYDLTFSSGPNGEQSTMVLGEGRSPTIGHLKTLGKETGIRPDYVNEVIDQVQHALSQWEELANQCGVLSSNIALIGQHLQR